MYFSGVEEDIQQDILQETCFVRGNLPFKYLGVPLDSRKLTMVNCFLWLKRLQVDSLQALEYKTFELRWQVTPN